MASLRIALFGAGRIGQVHAKNVAASEAAHLAWVVDVDREAAQAVAERYGAHATTEAQRVFDDDAVDAVIIASPTPTHVELIGKAAAANKAIFCEKPIDLDLDRVDDALEVVERQQVPFFVGFNRRFDPSFSRLKAQLATGRIGRLEVLTITSRDPSPPTMDYLARSGGLFADMMIHDFDMARWLLGEEPVEIFATASTLVDPAIAELGDVDTALVTLRTDSGALCQISNSRRAAYGYDQRVEAHGAAGMLIAENAATNTVLRFTEAGQQRDPAPRFFVERYAEAYRAELEHFLFAVRTDGFPLLTGPEDGRQALVLAHAAHEAMSRRRAVPVPTRLR